MCIIKSMFGLWSSINNSAFSTLREDWLNDHSHWKCLPCPSSWIEIPEPTSWKFWIIHLSQVALLIHLTDPSHTNQVIRILLSILWATRITRSLAPNNETYEGSEFRLAIGKCNTFLLNINIKFCVLGKSGSKN